MLHAGPPYKVRKVCMCNQPSEAGRLIAMLQENLLLAVTDLHQRPLRDWRPRWNACAGHEVLFH
jgi:hypothetical protein